ncbi:LysR family transcriptional regulator ArgP [Microbacterium sp. C7(2022)]|uniref:LysR family transcriptional regulator ArgP n=1 Tax=Microbacterium sp. C7(2022) TaxID=2992759 RepID=UPI00237BAE98|nr:LysR family transcriptional regulator ArgP [Microbacterium sp. C7(2022)]MDE0546096.1 LysR family transcriptional regulator ArgP [Microbacterium sp. C7(2022)]
MNEIPLDLAETLAAAVDEGTFEAAARRLHITPSAVSQRIKALEGRLGRVLLVRSKPIRPTEAGAAVLRFARQAATLAHDTLTELGMDDGDAVRARVPLAVNADSLATWFVEPLARLSEQHPVVFDLHRDDQGFTAELLESGTVIGAVTSQTRAVGGCRVSPLGAMRYEAVATPGFAARWFGDGVDAHALGRAPVVDFDRRDELQNDWLRAYGSVTVSPPRHYVPASQDFAAAVLAGMGWAMLPSFQSASGLASGALIRLGGRPLDVPLHWQQWNLSSPLLDAIASEIVDTGRRVLRR